MSERYGILGQAAPPSATLTIVYAVPVGKRAVLSTINVCNRAGAGTTFRVSTAPDGAADNPKHALYFDLPIPANETFERTSGLALGPKDELRFYAGSDNLTCQAFGTEVDA